MKHKLLGNFIIIVSLVLGAYLTGSGLMEFIDLPSFLMVLGIVLGTLFGKYGLDGWLYFRQSDPLRSEIAKIGGSTAIVSGVLCSIMGLIMMLNNLSDPRSIGPAMAVSFLTSLYGLILYLLFFLPYIKVEPDKHNSLTMIGPLILLSLCGHSISMMLLSFFQSA